MNVDITDEAREYVNEHGGVVFVTPHAHRCCQGSITLLDTTMQPRADADAYIRVGSDGVDVRFPGGSARQPDTLVIELRGVRRRHLVSFWDGCAYRP